VDKKESIHNQLRLTRDLLFTGLCISIIICGVYLIHPAFIASTNNRTTDVVMSLASPEPIPGSVVIIDIDENSLSKHGQWPWSRNLLARLLSAISESGAESIGLDMILAEPDRTSSAQLQPANDNKSVSRSLSSTSPHYIANSDALLAEVLNNGPFVLGYDFLFKDIKNGVSSCKPHSPGIAWINKAGNVQGSNGIFKATGVVCNQKLFSDAVEHSGFLNATPDADGILRRMPMLIQFDDQLYPSLTLAMLMQYVKTSQLSILQRDNGIIDLIVGNRSISVDTQGNKIVSFARRGDIAARISADDLLEGKISANQFKNKIVLVGSSAAGLENVFQTPSNPVHSHVDIHAQILNNVLTGHQVIRTREFLLWEAIVSLLVIVCVCLAIARMRIVPSVAVCVALLSAIWLAVVYLFQAKGHLYSPLLPTTLVILNFAILTIFKTWKIQIATRSKADEILVQLKSSEKNLNSIIKAVPDIIFRLDPTGRITFISPSISKYSASPDTLIGQSIFDLVVPDDLPKAHFRLNEKRTGERATQDLELRLLLPRRQDGVSGETGHFSVSAEGIYQAETPCTKEFIGTQGIIHDITEHKKLEEKLLNAQKMETIGNLAAGVAHDLNNILAGLITYPELILMELPPDSPLYNKIKLIQQSGQRAASIVEDLLALGRRGLKSKEIVNLNVTILEYLASLEFATVLKHHPLVTLERQLAPDLLDIMGSRSHLAKSIMNLLTNAAEAMPAGGAIRICSYNNYLEVPFSGYEEIPSGEYVCFSISDQGIGISDEELPRIFEPFFSKKSMKRSGSGLGMTVIWATVKDHAGFIDIQSREGMGTTFVIYLPVCRNKNGESAHRFVLEDYIGSEHVVVVDDIPEQRFIVSGMLTKLGYRVTTCSSGEEAVSIMQTQNADLVVLDMIMPGGIDGLETYERIIDIRPGQRAIVTSGFSESERVKALLKLGAGAYLQKPYTLEKLGVAVRKELDRH